MLRPSPWSRKKLRDLTVWLPPWCWCWRWWPGVGTSVPVRVPLPEDARIRGFKPPVEVFNAMKMPDLEGKATSGDPTPIEHSKLLAKMPNLNQLLHDPMWTDGPYKGKRCVMVFIEGTVVKVMVKVEGQRLKSMVSARSLDEALACWETLLKAGTVPWEQEDVLPPQQSRKRK